VAIVGPGQQGLAAVAVAKEAGAGPIMLVGLERDAQRLAMAERFGADVVINADQEDPVEAVARATGGAMAGLVMDVTGHPKGAETALSLCGLGATLVLPGLYGPQTKVPLLLDKVVVKELKVLGVYSHDFKAVEPAIRMAAGGGYPFEDMITHRLPLEQAEHAIKLVAGEVPGENAMKVVLDPAL
jgi:alcohol dehydrogenase